MPFSRRALDRNIGPAEDSFGVLPHNGAAVQRPELFCQGSKGLLLQNRNQAFEAAVFARMEVDQVPARRDGRVPERLEITPHVLEHRDDEVASRPAVLFDELHLQNDRIAYSWREVLGNGLGCSRAFERLVRTGFGRFLLNSETRQLLRDGGEVHLSPKAFDVLCTLVARRPNVVSKAELFGLIWPNTFVVEGNLNVLVSEIRRAISEDAQSPQFIRTAHGVGYAFCGEATEIGGDRRGHEEPASRCWLVWTHRTFVLTAGDNVIGRDPGCDVWLDHSDVSRRHARIRIAGEMKPAVLEDLKSTNGTFVGRKQVMADTTLADGDVIKFGSVKLTFRSWSAEPSRTKKIRKAAIGK